MGFAVGVIVVTVVLGALAFRSGWLPAEIAEPIRFHHRPELAAEEVDCCAIVGLADIVGRAAGTTIEENTGLFQGHEAALEILGIDIETTEAVLDEFLVVRNDAFQEALIFWQNRGRG